MKQQLLTLMLLLGFATHTPSLFTADLGRLQAERTMQLDYNMRNLQQELRRLQVQERDLLEQQDAADQLEQTRARIRIVREGIRETQKKLAELGR